MKYRIEKMPDWSKFSLDDMYARASEDITFYDDCPECGSRICIEIKKGESDRISGCYKCETIFKVKINGR